MTVEEALEEADKLKLSKQESAITEYETRKDQKVVDVFSVWVDELRKRSERKTTENTTADRTYYKRAKTTIYKYISLLK